MSKLHNPEGRFELKACTANGVHELSRWDFESAARIDMERWAESLAQSEDPWVLILRDRWDRIDGVEAKIGEIVFTPARHMLKPGVPCPKQHAEVAVTVKNDIHDNDTLTGTFRGRVMGIGAPFFDREGSAIWLTTMMEHFIEIKDIVSIEELD